MPSYEIIDLNLEDGFRLIQGDDINVIVQAVNRNAFNVRLHTTSGDVTAHPEDHTIIIRKNVGAATSVFLPNFDVSSNANIPLNLYPGRRFQIKDGKGDAPANHITVVPPPGITIDGASSYVIQFAYESIDVVFNSIEYSIL